MKYEIRSVISVDYNEVEKLIKEVYGHQFSLVADQEQGNDSTVNLDVKKAALEDYEQEDVDSFTATGKGDYLLNTLLTDLANKDLIPEGEYLISICW